MKKTVFSYSAFFLFLLFAFSCNTNTKEAKALKTNRIHAETLNSVDGPYIYTQKDSLRIVTVERDAEASFYIQKRTVKNEDRQFICEVDNTDNDYFSFSLMDGYKMPEAIYEPQEKILVTSDIEGNFNAFYSLLVGNKVMDKEFNWTFGTGHLVIAGDMVDRGTNVIPCLWLLYKLEQDALKAGGQVHYILGNHDVMNIKFNIKYVQPKYIQLAKILSKKEDGQEAFKYLMSSSNELVKWMKSKNCIEKIGNNLFVHGGISMDIVDADMSIQEINDILRKHIHEILDQNPKKNDYVRLVLRNKGPLWYRGLVRDYKGDYKKISSTSLDYILEFYDVAHIIIGHTIVDDEVTSDFDGKVIRVDIKHPAEKFTGKSQALLILNDTYYKVNDEGKKSGLFAP